MVVPGLGPAVAIVASRCSAQSLWSLIRAGADVNVLTPSGETLLIVAAKYNEQYGCECIKLLLNIGAKINQVNWQGGNALQSHIWYCTWEKRILTSVYCCLRRRVARWLHYSTRLFII